MAKLSGQIKKVTRFILWLMGIGVVLIVALAIGIRIFFPESKIKSLIRKEIFKSTGRELTIEKLSWNLMGALDAVDVRLGHTAAEGRHPSPLLSVSQARIRFRLLPLLRRELKISEIRIDHPEIFIVPPATGVDSTIVKQTSDTLSIDSQTQQVEPIPVSLELSRFSIHHFDLTLLLQDTLFQSIRFSDLNLSVQHLRIPRGFPDTKEMPRGEISFFTGETDLRIRNSQETWIYQPDIRVDIDMQKHDVWTMAAFIDIQKKRHKESLISFLAKIKGEGFADILHVDTLSVNVGQKKLVSISGEGKDITKRAPFQLEIISDLMPVQSTLEFLKPLIPEQVVTLLDTIHVDGLWHPLSGVVAGDTSNIQFKLQSNLQHGLIETDVTRISPFQYQGQVEGAWSKKGFHDTQISFTADADSVVQILNDTITISFHDVFVDLKTGIGKYGLPSNGRLNAHVLNLFDGALTSVLNWSNPSDTTFEMIQVHGDFHLDSLQFNTLPNMTNEFQGQLDAGGQFDVNGFNQIDVNLSGTIDDLSFLAGEVLEQFPALPFSMTNNLHLDYPNTLYLDSARIGFTDVFQAVLKGQYHLPNQSFQVNVEKAKFENASIEKILPLRLKQQLQMMRFFGTESFSAELQGQIEGAEINGNATGLFQVLDAGFEDPVNAIRIDGFNHQLSFHGDLKSWEGKSQADLASVLIEALRPEPIETSSLKLDWALNRDSLSIYSGHFNVPAFAVQGEMSMYLGKLRSNPDLLSELELSFISQQGISLIDSLVARGHVVLRLKAFSSDLQKNAIRISGDLHIDSLVIERGSLIALNHIQAHIPLELLLNPATGKLLIPEDWKPHHTSTYEVVRPYYRFTNQTVENFQIQEIHFQEYVIKNTLMDISIHKGIIDVPRFSMDVLEGRIGGSFWLNLGNGNPDSIRYGIRAHITRVNSAALQMGGETDEKTELNANLDFSGMGVDVTKNIDLDGYFHITQIGPSFASTLLKGINPGGKDSGMKMTRFLLDRGYKPKVFSFEMRHGYVYPSLSLSQPWYLPVRIPGRLEYGRLPVAVLINNPNLLSQK